MPDLWDIHQHRQIKHVKQQQSANQAVNEVRHKRVANHSEQNETRVERLLLLTEAMWTLMAEPLGLTTEHLAAKIDELDGLDGHLDGRRSVRGVAPECRNCGARVNREHSLCQFCGTPSHDVAPFDRI